MRTRGRDVDDGAELVLAVIRDRAIFPVYQPVVDLATGDIVAVEALARGPAGSAIESAPALFAAARRADRLSELDQLCFTRAIEVAAGAGDAVPSLLLVNAEPSVADAPISPEVLSTVRGPHPFRVVMEFTERSLAHAPAALLRLTRMAHADGNAIALDDVGSDPVSSAFLPLLDPAIIKLDAHLVQDSVSAATMTTSSIVDAYAERTGAVVIAEGIETTGQLASALRLGAHWGQGWLFGRPGPLAALSGRRMRSADRLHRRSFDVPDGSPLTYAARSRPVRQADRREAQALAQYLVGVAAAGGPHTIFLANYSDTTFRDACQPASTRAETAADYTAVATPPSGSAVERNAETTIVVIGPHVAIGLCARPVAEDRFHFVLTHEPDLAHALARLLISTGTQPGDTDEVMNPAARS